MGKGRAGSIGSTAGGEGKGAVVRRERKKRRKFK